MSCKRRRIESAEDWADVVVEMALAQSDWVSRHQFLDLYMRCYELKVRIPERLSPCQSKYGTLTGKSIKLPCVIPLHEYASGKPVHQPPLKQTTLNQFLLENDQTR